MFLKTCFYLLKFCNNYEDILKYPISKCIFTNYNISFFLNFFSHSSFLFIKKFNDGQQNINLWPTNTFSFKKIKNEKMTSLSQDQKMTCLSQDHSQMNRVNKHML